MHLFLGIKFCKFFYHPLILQFQDCGYVFSTSPPPYFLGQQRQTSLQCCLSTAFFLKHGSFRVYPCRLHRIFHVADGRRTFDNISKGLYTHMWSAQGHTKVIFYHWSDYQSCCLNNFLKLDGAYLLEVGWRLGFYSLMLPAVTSTFGIFLVVCFIRCFPFVDLFRYFHFIEHLISIPVSIHL